MRVAREAIEGACLCLIQAPWTQGTSIPLCPLVCFTFKSNVSNYHGTEIRDAKHGPKHILQVKICLFESSSSVVPN